MAQYSIKDIEKLSGIKAHTIRIWEKRYNLFQPERTKTNIRYYSDETLKQIIKISSLNNNGFKISKIAALSAIELNKKILELNSQKNNYQIHIDQLVMSMLDLDESAFNKQIQNTTSLYGFQSTVIDIIYPFLDKIGVLWSIGKIHPAHEHFVSNLIRQKIIAAIDELDVPKTTASKTIVLFLPEHDLHEIGLLFYHYAFKAQGNHVIYLGQAVPYNDLKMIVSKYEVDLLFSSFISNMTEESFKDYLLNLDKDFKGCDIQITGRLPVLHTELIPERIEHIKNVKEVQKNN